MDWQSVGRWAIAVVPAAVALVGVLQGPGALRSRLRHDIEMLEKLPKDSAAHAKLLGYIDAQMERFAKVETDSRRDWNGLIGGTVASVVLGVAFMGLGAYDTWWSLMLRVLAVLSGLTALIVVFESAGKVPRNEKGHRIRA